MGGCQGAREYLTEPRVYLTARTHLLGRSDASPFVLFFCVMVWWVGFFVLFLGWNCAAGAMAANTIRITTILIFTTMISPQAYVDPSAQLGKDVTVHPFAFIDADTVVGDGCEIMPYASIVHGTRIGKNVKVYQGAIVGADPQDFRWKGEAARCSVGDNTIIREQVIINRGFATEEGTCVGADCFVLAGSHIGHDSRIAEKCVIGNNVSIAGHVEVDKGTILSSAVVLHERATVGKFALLKGGTRISSNVPPFTIIAHNPATYFGPNSVVMQKHAGFSEAEIEDIAKAYRHIYRSSTSLFNALKRIEEDVAPGAVRDEILGFIRGHNMQIAGERFADC